MLSQQIKALERDFGDRLFELARRLVTLTAAGSALFPDARALPDRADGLERRGLDAGFTGAADRLYAVSAGGGTGAVAARDTAVLLDSDTTAWSSWNAYTAELARETGAEAVRISDGGIMGPGFFDHVRRSGRSVTNPPKGQGTPLSPTSRGALSSSRTCTGPGPWYDAGTSAAPPSWPSSTLCAATATSEPATRAHGCPQATRTGTSLAVPLLTCAGSLRLPGRRIPVPVRGLPTVDFSRSARLLSENSRPVE